MMPIAPRRLRPSLASQSIHRKRVLAIIAAVVCTSAVLLALSFHPISVYRAFPNRDARITFEKSERLIVYSLDPGSEGRDLNPKAEQFHGFSVLGRTEIKDKRTQEEIVTDLYSSLSYLGQMALCWEPRHGIRAIRDGQTVDLVICYRCGGIQTYYNGLKAGSGIVGRSDLLNQILYTNEIPVASNDGS
jgi:hypothetical protein